MHKFCLPVLLQRFFSFQQTISLSVGIRPIFCSHRTTRDREHWILPNFRVCLQYHVCIHVTPWGQRTLVGVATRNHATCWGSLRPQLAPLKHFWLRQNYNLLILHKTATYIYMHDFSLRLHQWSYLLIGNTFSVWVAVGRGGTQLKRERNVI